jgi:hypothetical protein
MSREREEARGLRAEIAVGLAAALAVALIAFHPAELLTYFPRYATVVGHLPGRGQDGADPVYTHVGYKRRAYVDTAAIRRAGALIPNDAIYYVATGVDNQSSENVPLAARLFFLPAVPAQRPQDALWILSYRMRTHTPARRVYHLDPDLELSRVR